MGAGFKGGCVVGASDETTDHVKERPVTPQDFLGSIMELSGVDPDDVLPNPKWLKEYGPVMNPQTKSPLRAKIRASQSRTAKTKRS